MTQFITCLNPSLCGVQAHRPGTDARCRQRRSAGSSEPSIDPNPTLSLANVRKIQSGEYSYVDPEEQPTEYGDHYDVPVSDIAKGVAEDYGREIEVESRTQFSFQGHDEMGESACKVTVTSKRDQVYVDVEWDDGRPSYESEGVDVQDLGEAKEWLDGLMEEY